MKNRELVKYLTNCGVCNICQLRYIKGCNHDYTKDIKITLDCLNVRQDTETTVNLHGDYISKKSRAECCPTCFGLFSSHFQNQLINKIVNCNIEKYDCPKVVVAICLPVILQIHQLSMWYACLEKFDSNLISKEKAPDISLKEVFKTILNPTICKKLRKEYDQDGGGSSNTIIINIILNHTKEIEELSKLQELHKKAFALKHNAKKQNVSRGILDRQYTPNQISADLFKEYFPVPPHMGIAEDLYLESIRLIGPTIYVAGRYCKITRELSHTPWILNGLRIMDDSIEEIINRAIVPHFCNEPSKAIFMSSGREDVDVRCLGKGRPFVVEMPNSFKTHVTQSEAYRMECDINKSLKVFVRNIQTVKREELVNIKSGEEQKRKLYRALCILTETEATVELLEKLNIRQGFQVTQKTPIRVLHRRPLHSRPRMIYSLKAYVQEGNPKVLILDIVSQAGTYIKELVHGEFGRTTPSICSIIEQPIDIMALDVMAIDLEWPQDIDNSKDFVKEK